jgi:RNA polymerase sigma-70 factor (ECF subfamily)
LNIESVWLQYRNSLRAFLQSKISNHADVDDLLQDILIKTHNQIGSLRSHEKLKPWLFSIANNTVIDFYRKRGRDIHIELEDNWYSDREVNVQLQLSECLIPFIDMLPAKTAKLLKEVDIKGVSQKSCAIELGISYSALKSQVQRGRSQLRALFESCCHLELDPHGNVIGYEPQSSTCKNC